MNGDDGQRPWLRPNPLADKIKEINAAERHKGLDKLSKIGFVIFVMFSGFLFFVMWLLDYTIKHWNGNPVP